MTHSQREAAFWVALLQRTALEQLTPRQLADLLAVGIHDGQVRVGAAVTLRLRELGEQWPPQDLARK